MDYSDDKHKGDVEIVYDLQLDGMITGNATVKDGIFLQLNGMVGKSLIIESGCSVELNGTVSEDVVNKGGNLEVYGSVNGRLVHQDGSTNINENADISGEIEGMN